MFPRESPYLPLLKILLVILAVLVVCQLFPSAVWIIIGGLALVAIALAGIALVTVACVKWRNWRAPRRTVAATVVRKWTHHYDLDLPTRGPTVLGPVVSRFSSPATTVYTQWVFWVSFRVNGEEIDFSVPEKTYIALTEGMKGLLTSKGERFIEFRL